MICNERQKMTTVSLRAPYFVISFADTASLIRQNVFPSYPFYYLHRHWNQTSFDLKRFN